MSDGLFQYRTVRVIALFFVLYFAFLVGFIMFVERVSEANYEKTFYEYECCFPMNAVEKSFRSYSSPPWVMSNHQIKNKEMFLELLNRDDLFAIYRESDYWNGEIIYYGAISPADHSTFIAVFRYKPIVTEIDNGWLRPKTYQIH